MATRCVQKTRRDCHRSATSTSTCWDATRSPYLNRSLGASSGRSETPLTAVANRTFRSIAPQTPSCVARAGARADKSDARVNHLPARIDPEEAAIGGQTATARRLVNASVSPNTRRAYAGALSRRDAWLDGRELDDASLAELHDAGRASSSASMAVAAACFRAKLRGLAEPGRRTHGPGAGRLPADRR